MLGSPQPPAPREFYFQWHLTERCNLRCLHCYQESYSAEADEHAVGAMADQLLGALRRWSLRGRISLTGGEPLLSPHLFPLLERFNEAQEVTSLAVLTNGTLIDGEAVARLRGLGKLHQVQVSLDGSSAGSHDRLRGEGAFAAAVRGIRRLRDGGVPVSVMFTLTPENLDDVPFLVDLALAEGVEALTVERVVPPRGFGGRVLGSDEVGRAYEALGARAEEAAAGGLRVRRRRPLWVNTLRGRDPAVTGIGGFCPVGLTALTILQDGTLLPCRRLPLPLGNLLKEGIYSVWYTSPVLWAFRRRRNLHGRCGACEHLALCGGCRAVAYSLTGDYLGEDPQCWRP